MLTVYQTIIQYIDDHIKDEITLDEIADAIGYSANHIYKLFGLYSPHPVMEYIRKKKLYAAASEMYTGRKLYDIALDYGYETPAGFYKAFKSIFGCSPSEYKKSIRKDINTMRIDHVKTIQELEEGLNFFKSLYPDHFISEMDTESEEKFGRKWWIRQFENNAEFLLYAKEENEICAATFGFVDGEGITIHEGVKEAYRASGIFEALFAEMEKRGKQNGYKEISLGINEGEEEFYAKMGYTGKMLIQSEKYSVEELKKFNERYNQYEITGTNVYEGYVNQLWLNGSLLDKGLKKHYEAEVGDCWVQVIVHKEL